MQNIRVQERKRQYFNFGRPSLFPSVEFDAKRDAQEIKDALEKKKSSVIPFGGGTSNSMAVAKILGRRTADQRRDIKKEFNKISSTSLEDTIKKKFPKDCQDLMIESIMGTYEYLANEMNDALKEKDKYAILDIIVGLSNNEITRLKNMYQGMFNKDLTVSVKEIMAKEKVMCDLFVKLLSCKRPEPPKYQILLRDFAAMVNLSKAAKDAQFLANNGIPKMSENSDAINLLCDRTKPELRACFEEIFKITDDGFAGLVEKKIKEKDMREDVKSIGFALAYPEEYFTDRLYQSMKGIGTKDRILRRVCLMRSEVDMEDIKLIYRFIKNTELIKDVEGDTSGEYRSMLSSLIGV